MQQIMELKAEGEGLLKGVENEVTQPEEWDYIERRRFLPTDLQNTIEETLISSRRGFYGIMDLSRFIRDALLVPYETKPLTPSHTEQEYESLRQRFYADPFFAAFEQRIQDRLWGIVSSLYFTSHCQTDHGLSYRDSYYIWGNPGVGKSATARHIAEFAGLPYSEPPVRTEEDFTQDILEGTIWSHSNPKKGWFVNCLCKKAKDGKTYINGIMIINDFDRMFLTKGPRAEAALAFLMDYLDPERRKVFSPYFNTEVDISRLVIIITGNSPIPEEKKFDALRNRFGENNIIKFPDVGEAFATTILSTNFQLYNLDYRIPDSLMEGQALERAVIKYVVAESDQPSVRSYNNHLRRIFHGVRRGNTDTRLVTFFLKERFHFACQQLDLPDDISSNDELARTVAEHVVALGNHPYLQNYIEPLQTAVVSIRNEMIGESQVYNLEDIISRYKSHPGQSPQHTLPAKDDEDEAGYEMPRFSPWIKFNDWLAQRWYGISAD